MAQNITLLGANYSNVPGVDLPKTGGGTARFTDVTPTTAAAADVAQGKQFYTADGTLTQGTASGGGGGAGVVMGAIRGDAEKIWTYEEDDLLVADLGLAIGNWSSSARTLQAGQTIDTLEPDWANYSYFETIRYICTPVYATAVKGKGRPEYCIGAGYFEFISTAAGVLKSFDGRYSGGSPTYRVGNAPITQLIAYWTGATAFNAIYGAYGFYRTIVAPTASATALTIKNAAIGERGHTSYFTETYWNAVEDVRLQAVYEVWRVPNTEEVKGWAATSQIYHVADCINSGGDLT